MRIPHLIAGFLLGVGCTLAFGVSGLELSKRAAVTSFEAAERRVAPNGKADVRILAHGVDAFFGHLRMDGGAEVPQHRDTSEEYLHILSGEGVITIDGQGYPLKAGDSVYMPRNAEVSFKNGERELVAVQVFADNKSAAKYDAWKVVGGTR